MAKNSIEERIPREAEDHDVVDEHLDHGDGDDDFVLDISFVKLVTGVEILAEVTTVTGKHGGKTYEDVVLTKPLTLMTLPPAGPGEPARMMGFPMINMMISKQDSINISPDHILFIVDDLKPEMFELYAKVWDTIESMDEASSARVVKSDEDQFETDDSGPEEQTELSDDSGKTKSRKKLLH